MNHNDNFEDRVASFDVADLECESFLEKNKVDLIILDIMLPEMDGFQVLQKIRSNHSIPVIMLTARGEVTDRIVGLELGADDYLSLIHI